MKTKNRIWFCPLIVMGLVLMLTISCKKSNDNNNPSGTITDEDGNVYTSITIGTQIWMVENLKTTKYNDGTSILLVTDATDWSNLSTPGYCWYNNDASTNKVTYGALYNWFAISTTTNGGKNVCPTSWHVPTDAEWTILTDYLGGESSAGGILKETGTIHWLSPNTGATNEAGFKALPGGTRYFLDGSFDDIGSIGYWWSTTQATTWSGWGRGMYNDNSDVTSLNFDKTFGFSVRCIKD